MRTFKIHTLHQVVPQSFEIKDDAGIAHMGETKEFIQILAE
jgi:hypothetical protein